MPLDIDLNDLEMTETFLNTESVLAIVFTALTMSIMGFIASVAVFYVNIENMFRNGNGAECCLHKTQPEMISVTCVEQKESTSEHICQVKTIRNND